MDEKNRELYYLLKNRSETNNLIESETEKATQLMKAYKEWTE